MEDRGEGIWILFEFERSVKEWFCKKFSITPGGQFMRNAVMTKWDLTPHDKVQAFLSELIDYLQKNLLQVKRFPDSPDSELIWICRENYTNIMRGCGDRNYEWAMYSKRFCKMRNFY